MPPLAAQVVQISVDTVLNGRPVSTLTAGAIVPWTVGIDKEDGYITNAAAKFLKQTDKALPDDATFAEDATHPEMVLHFSNSESATSPQARGVSGVSQFEFDVPHATYSELFLALSSSYGDSALSITFEYADASTSAQQFTLPDWGTGAALPTNPPIFFNLISGLHKWTRSNESVDTPSHTITGVKLSPEPSKELNRIRIDKTAATPYLVFWGATGRVTSTIGNSNGGAGGVSSAGGSSGAQATGSAGAAGIAGAAGAFAGGGSSAGASGSSGAQAAGASGGTAQGGASGNASAGSSASGEGPVLAGAENEGCTVSVHGARRTGFPGSAWLFALCALLFLRRTNWSR